VLKTPTWLILIAAFGLLMGCGDSDETTTDASTGGATADGSATGGAATGGATTGGAAMGGVAMGGAATGGTDVMCSSDVTEPALPTCNGGVPITSVSGMLVDDQGAPVEGGFAQACIVTDTDVAIYLRPNT